MGQISYNTDYTNNSNNKTRYAIVNEDGSLKVSGSSGTSSISGDVQVTNTVSTTGTVSISDGDIKVVSEYLYSDTQSSLANGASITSGWLDMSAVDKYQLEASSDELLNVKLESSTEADGAGASITSNTTMPATFFLFNVIARQRYMRFTLENNTGQTVGTSSLSIKASYGSSDKLSVFPVAVEPSNFSQAALVQAISKGQQPDGDYVNEPADGTAFNTSDTLDANGTFSSPWIDSDGWKSMELFINSDVASETGGVVLNFSSDSNAASPVIVASQSYTFTEKDSENGYMLLKLAPVLDGLRVDYINGSATQSDFNMDLIFRNAPSQVEEKYSGPYLQNSKSFFFKVGVGQEVGHSSNTKFGHNSDIDISSAPEDIWEGGGNYTGQPVSDVETIDVSSSSANDTAAGTGARTVKLFGLNQDWEEITEELTLNGTSDVTTTNQWRRMYRMQVLTAGSGGGNAGVVSAHHTTTTANIFAAIPVGRNQTAVGAITVPAGKQLFILNTNVDISRSNGSPGSAEISLRIREEGGVYQAKRFTTVTTNYAWMENPETVNGPYPEKTDIKFRVDSVSDNNTVASATFEYMLVDNGFV